jgi:hypothetical protein
MVKSIDEFNKAEDTKKFETEFNWNIVLGQID